VRANLARGRIEQDQTDPAGRASWRVRVSGDMRTGMAHIDYVDDRYGDYGQGDEAPETAPPTRRARGSARW
jgi:hypothetical protein